jgi:hypothetical protein
MRTGHRPWSRAAPACEFEPKATRLDCMERHGLLGKYRSTMLIRRRGGATYFPMAKPFMAQVTPSTFRPYVGNNLLQCARVLDTAKQRGITQAMAICPPICPPISRERVEQAANGQLRSFAAGEKLARSNLRRTGSSLTLG